MIPEGNPKEVLKHMSYQVLGRAVVVCCAAGSRRQCEGTWLCFGRPILPRITGSMEPRCCNVLCCGMLPQVYGCLADVTPSVCIPRLIPPSWPARPALFFSSATEVDRLTSKLFSGATEVLRLTSKLFCGRLISPHSMVDVNLPG